LDRSLDAEQILEEHGSAMRIHAPALLRNYSRKAMSYHLMAGKRGRALRTFRRYGTSLAGSPTAWAELGLGLLSSKALLNARSQWQYHRYARRSRAPRVVYFGGYDPQYTRVRTVVKGLRRAGAQVVECSSQIKPRPFRYAHLTWEYFRIGGGTNTVVVSEAGHAYVPLAYILTTLTRRSLIFDAFYPYSLVEEEKDRPPGALGKAWYHWLDGCMPRLCDAVLVDTTATADYFASEFNLPRDLFHPIPIGSDDELYFPRDTRHSGSRLSVLLVTSFYALHGVEHVLQAAHLLRDHHDVSFMIVGDGPMKAKMQALAGDLNLTNTAFLGRISPRLLPLLISDADICLGQFGNTEHAHMVIPAKVFDALAMAKPVITSDARTVKSELRSEDAVFFCDIAVPTAIRDAILTLKNDNDLRARLSANGYRVYQDRYSLDHVGQSVAAVIKHVSGSRSI